MASNLKKEKDDEYKGIIKNGLIVAPVDKIIRLPIGLVRADPNQVRRHIPPAALKRLSESIKMLGQRKPIDVLLRDNGKWAEVDDGERRYRATIMAELPSIRCIIRTEEYSRLRKAVAAKKEKFLSGAIANVGREDISLIEKGLAVEKLMKDFSWNQSEAARALCMDASTAGAALKVLQLCPDLQEKLMRGELKPGLAQILAPWPHDKQMSQYELAVRLEEERGRCIHPNEMALKLKEEAEVKGFVRRQPKHKRRDCLTPMQMIMRNVMRHSQALVASLGQLASRPAEILAQQRKPSYFDLHQELMDLERHLTRETKRASAQL